MAIRGCKLRDLQGSFPTTPVRDLVPHLTQDPLLEGYLYKTGPRIGDSYHKRFFELYPNKLIYSDEPMVSIFYMKLKKKNCKEV